MASARRGGVQGGDQSNHFQVRDGASLTQQARERLRREILTGVRKPGEFVSANGLTEDYGISRSPIREALENAVFRRLVVGWGPNGGRVGTVNEAGALECFRLLFAIECQVAHALSDVLDDLRHLQLGQMLDQLACMADANSPDSLELHDQEVAFHRKMAEQAGMRLAEEFISITYDQLRLFRPELAGDTRGANAENRTVLAAIRDCSANRAKLITAAVRAHSLGACSRLAPSIVKALETSI